MGSGQPVLMAWFQAIFGQWAQNFIWDVSWTFRDAVKKKKKKEAFCILEHACICVSVFLHKETLQQDWVGGEVRGKKLSSRLIDSRETSFKTIMKDEG